MTDPKRPVVAPTEVRPKPTRRTFSAELKRALPSRERHPQPPLQDHEAPAHRRAQLLSAYAWRRCTGCRPVIALAA
jgi:hypothetical protein